MTITLAAVYAPIGLQGGLTGSLFREFAFTLAGAVVISGVVALTLSPMMSAYLLKPGDEDKGFPKMVAGVFSRLRAGVRARARHHPCQPRFCLRGLGGDRHLRRAHDHAGAHRTGARRGPGGHLRIRDHGRRLHAGPEPALRRRRQQGVLQFPADGLRIPADHADVRNRGAGRQALGAAEGADRPDAAASPGEGLGHSRPPVLPRPAAADTRGRQFPGRSGALGHGRPRPDPAVRAAAAPTTRRRAGCSPFRRCSTRGTTSRSPRL